MVGAIVGTIVRAHMGRETRSAWTYLNLIENLTRRVTRGGGVTPSYINAYTCAHDLFIGGLFPL